MENAITIVDLTPENFADYGVCGYKDVKKHAELRNKIAWFETYHPKGLMIKTLISEEGGYQGMIEYIPGKYAHRPVNADNYMFIHCVFVGFKKEYKGKGYATRLIEECIQEAQQKGMAGVAVVTRKGAFMAKKEIFEKLDFEIVDSVKPDFKLLVKKFDANAENPTFRKDVINHTEKYQHGLTIMRSVQCPYTEKNVKAIVKSAQDKFDLEVNLVDLAGAEDAQACPSAFGAFCIIHDGEILSYHPISNTRFENIMKKRNTDRRHL